MPGESGAACLFGREREQAVLFDALSLALRGDHQVVVVAGDAGVGKTALVADLARRAEDLGFSVTRGHCLDIETDISFAPVTEALGTLVAGVQDLELRPFARRVRAMLDPETPTSLEQPQLHEELRLAVLEAAAAGPVLLVLEDLHWADRSTQDLAVALSRTARGRLLFVLTVRSEDLHRRHPARTALAEIGRVPGGRRLDVGPLDRDGVADIVASITGGPPDPAVVHSVLERSEGNPLYAEEIAAAGTGTIPDQLSDLFLARVDALADGPRALVRAASVDGTHVDADVLADLVGLDTERLHALLRELLDANVLRSVGESLEFRHGLLREAVYDDLLPDERTHLHAEVAEILQGRIDSDADPRLSTLSRLAYHWSAAHDLPRALVASVRAGVRATRLGTAESVIHLERAIALWERVPDAEALTGQTKIDLVLELARARLGQGDGERWHALNRRAVEMLQPDTAALLASRAHAAFAYSALNIDDAAAAPEAVRLALEYAGDPPSEERAYALGTQALLHIVSGRFTPGVQAAERAADAARAVDAVYALLLDLMFESEALMCLGRVSESCAAEERAIEVARSAGIVYLALDHVQHHAQRLLAAGQVTRAASVARAGRHEGLEAGLPVAAAFCGEPLVTALTWQGRFDEAADLLAALEDLGSAQDAWLWGRANLSLARGDVEAAVAVLPERALDPAWIREPPHEDDVLRRLRIAALRDDDAMCRATADSYLHLLEDCDSPVLAGCAARIGFQALTLAGAPRDAHAVGMRERAGRQLDRARSGLTDQWRTTYYGVQLALAEGYAARAAGENGAPGFRTAADLATPFGAFFALEPRLELAQELLAHRGRDEGRELLVACWTDAHAMGAGAVERQAVRLATRARVPLPKPATREGPLSRLTPREREVLDRLATGAANKAIAQDLVISEKTVSVHVSNVLAKLGVENRGAAAALARSLLDRPDRD